MIKRTAALFVISSIICLNAWAMPNRVNFQAVLNDASGVPIDGSLDVTFRLYNASSGGTLLWQEIHDSSTAPPQLTVVDGLFDLQLGDPAHRTAGTHADLSSLFAGEASVWLSIQIAPDPVMAPRIEITPSAWSLEASTLNGIGSSQFLRSDSTDTFDGTDGSYLVFRHPTGTTSNEVLYLRNGSTETGSNAGLRFQLSSNITANQAAIRAVRQASGGADLIFETSNDYSGPPTEKLRISENGQVDVAQNLFVGAGSNSDNDSVFFDDGTKSLTWDNTENQFEFDETLAVDELTVFKLTSLVTSGGTTHPVYFEGAESVHLRIDTDANNSTDEMRFYADVFVQFAEFQQDGDLRLGGTISQNQTFDVAENFWAGEALHQGELVRIDPTRSDLVVRTTGTSDTGVLGVISTSPGVLLGDAPFDAATIGRVWGADRLLMYEQQQQALLSEVLAAHPDLAQQRERLRAADIAESKGGAEGSSADETALFDRNLEGLALELFFERQVVPVALAGRVPVRVDASFGAIRPGDLLAPSPRPGVAMKSDGTGTIVATALEPLAEGDGAILAFVRLQSPSGAMNEMAMADITDRLTEIEAALSNPTSRRHVTATVTDSLTNQISVTDAPVPGSGSISENRTGAHRDELLYTDEADVRLAALLLDAMDQTEMFPVSELVSPGDVLVIDPDQPGILHKSTFAGDRAVAGIVSSLPGITLGGSLNRLAVAAPELAQKIDEARAIGDLDREQSLWQELEKRLLTGHVPLALSGSVPCHVDATFGAIAPGDLLVSSNTPGHAMRSDDPAIGTVIGKALEPLQYGTGTIRILVALR